MVLQFDEAMTKRVAAVKANKRVLRYVGAVDVAGKHCSVSLQVAQSTQYCPSQGIVHVVPAFWLGADSSGRVLLLASCWSDSLFLLLHMT